MGSVGVREGTFAIGTPRSGVTSRRTTLPASPAASPQKRKQSPAPVQEKMIPVPFSLPGGSAPTPCCGEGTRTSETTGKPVGKGTGHGKASAYC